MTETDVRTALDGWEKLRRRAIEVGGEYSRLKGWYVGPSPDSALTVKEFVSMHEIYAWLDCGREVTICFPLRYLWQPDWAEQEQARIEAENQAIAAKKAHEEENRTAT